MMNGRMAGFAAFLQETADFYDQLSILETALREAGTPYTPGREGKY